MIIEIVIDMKNFVIVLLIAIISFANSYYILGRYADSENFAGTDVSDAFIYSWNTGLGNASTSGFNDKDKEVLWIIYVINLIVVLAIMLNLVVAIMEDTFLRVKKNWRVLNASRDYPNDSRKGIFVFKKESI